jgi:hypothetical protein
MERGGIVAAGGTNITGAENGDKELEFTPAGECINGSSNNNIIDNCTAKGSGGDK